MTSTVPANLFVNVVPSVINAGGNALNLLGMFLTNGTRVPTNSVLSFSSGSAVTTYFGAGSQEDIAANGGTNKGSGYFGGYTNSTQTPASILFTQYNTSAVAAWLRGGNVSSMSLATLEAINGTLNITVDGYARSGTVNLSSATSFSSAASLIQTALNASEPVEANFTASIGASFTGTATGTSLVVTAVTGYISVGDVVAGTGVTTGTTIAAQVSGTTGGAGTYTLSASSTASSASLTTTSNVVNVTAVGSGTISVGQTVTGTSVPAGTVIVALGTGTGNTGTYVTSLTSANFVRIASESMVASATNLTVSFDSISGGFLITSGITGVASLMSYADTGTVATALELTSATGAVISQGAAASSPAAFMNNIVTITQNWASFTTTFDPDGGTGNTQKQAFAAWVNSQNNRYVYVCADPDASPAATLPATSSLGYILENNGNSGTCLVWEPSNNNYAAFVCGYIASLDFTRTNGRTTLAYRSQPGLVPTVTTSLALTNLMGSPQTTTFGNGYNGYCSIATANQGFINMQRGTITGSFQWVDSYVNQIWLNNQFQLALMELLQASGSIPYNQAGYALVEAALADPINAGLNFGAFRAGVPLSAAQIAEVNNSAGADIAPVLSTRGWYLQILPASAQTRQGRTSPPMTFWYMDGESIQSFNLASVLVQ